ncbi:MAG: NADH-quinone oxidoreductase subunit E, partial [Rikenellaceae bacterium]|nr:NADH-quinone oxidoreductase subunit E [Rikenellaceae bacterium]
MGKNILKRIDLIFKEEPDSKNVLKKTLSKSNDELINELIASGLKGRGGAGFPTGLKWKLTAESKSTEKYVIWNADEGEPGTFKDREILTQVPYKVLTGMAVCGRIIGARKGFIYLRGEYKYLLKELNAEIKKFHAICDELGLKFRVEVFMGFGA